MRGISFSAVDGMVRGLRGPALLIAMGLALPGCGSAQTLGQPITPGQAARYQITPIFDAHQHSMSPTAMALTVPNPAMPGITLPEELERLLRAREGVADDAAVATVFTQDAIVLDWEEARWASRPRLLRAIRRAPPAPRLIPKAFTLDGAVGSISGNVAWGGSGEEQGNFLIAVRRSDDGGWRISSEMMTEIAEPIYAPAITAESIIAVLDDAGIQKATLLPVAYWYGQPSREIDDRHGGTRAENDWNVREAAKFPDRLFPFCGVNPLADYAIAELDRCAAMPTVRGIKIHFPNAVVDVSNPEHIAKLRHFFRAANEHGLAIVVHFRGDPEILIRDILPEAPDVPIQIAHMGVPWSNTEVFADAIVADRPGTRNLYFDWTQALPLDAENRTPEMQEEAANIMRKIGLDRILFGSDMPLKTNASPRSWWRNTILTLPLTDDEISDIADNVPPYID